MNYINVSFNGIIQLLKSMKTIYQLRSVINIFFKKAGHEIICALWLQMYKMFIWKILEKNG